MIRPVWVTDHPVIPIRGFGGLERITVKPFVEIWDGLESEFAIDVISVDYEATQPKYAANWKSAHD